MLFSPSVLSDSLWPHGLQPTRLPVLHCLLEFGETYVHWVSDAIQPSHPLLSPSPPAFNLSKHQFSQFSSVSSMPGLPVHHQLREFTQTQRPSSQWCHPAISSSVVPFSSCPQPLPASVFSNESTLRMRWPKYWSFSFSIIPSKEHPGPISSRMNWLDLLAVQGTLKSLLQHHSSKASILWCSAFFIVELCNSQKDYAIMVLHSMCQHIWKTQQRPQNCKGSIFIPIPKKRSTEECAKHLTINKLE